MSAMQLEFDAPRWRRGSGVPSITVRDMPLTACEWNMMRAFLRRVHRDDLRRRFGHPFDIDDENTARRFFDVKAGSGEISWVLDTSGVIAGVAHRVMVSSAEAEIAVLVRSDCQRRGIGAFLVGAMLGRAARQGLKTLSAVMQRDNRAVLQLAAKFAYQYRSQTALTIELILDVARIMAVHVG